jgi:hypothetical protein
VHRCLDTQNRIDCECETRPYGFGAGGHEDTCAVCHRFAEPSEAFWDELEAQVQESLRQVTDRPRIQDLITATEKAVYRRGRQKHYAWLASQLFGQHVAATRLQAAWRGRTTRVWYTGYRKTEEFAERQAAYEAHARVRGRMNCSLSCFFCLS